MNPRTSSDPDLLRCPRCGADVADPEAGHCSCCGNSLYLGGRTADGTRAPLRMSLGLGQERARPSQRANTPAEGAFRASATGQGFAAVRQHHEYARWMSDAPAGFAHVLGMALTALLGVVFALLALAGALHVPSSDRGLVTAFCVCCGAGLTLWGTWRLVRFFQAPLLNRVARVADEREHTYRTKHGIRTRHYATFEFENGLRLEFQVSSAMAAEVVRGDCGVAITRDVFLLAFHRTGPA